MGRAPVAFAEGQALAEQIGAIAYLECSAKDYIGVQEVFQAATEAAIEAGITGQKSWNYRFRRLIKQFTTKVGMSKRERSDGGGGGGGDLHDHGSGGGGSGGGGSGGGGNGGGGGGAIERPDFHFGPISKEVMVDPVVAADGHIYERAWIANWFARGNRTSPMTNVVLANTNLIPCHPVKSAIQDPQWPV